MFLQHNRSSFQTESGPARRSWLATHHHEALQLGDADLDRVWNQARTLYTEDEDLPHGATFFVMFIDFNSV